MSINLVLIIARLLYNENNISYVRRNKEDGPIMITVTPEAINAIRLFLEQQGNQKPIRIHLQSTGCCDASLGLTTDGASADDIVENVEGIMFVIHPDVIALAGDITISHQNDKFDSGFVLTSERPISEWSGFGVCTIKV